MALAPSKQTASTMSIEAQPKLRHDLRFTRHVRDNAVTWVVKDPTAAKYFRVAQVEGWLMQQMDGTRTLQFICDALHSEVGMRATPGALEVLVHRLEELGLLEWSAQDCNTKIERVRQRRIVRNSRNSILRFRWSFGDPDALLERLVKALPFFWTRGFAIASGLVFLLYGVFLTLYWQPFAAGIAALHAPGSMTVGLWLLAICCFAVTAIIHELGHGLTCKRFGGEVHEIGAMLLYFMPAFYCNVSDAWTFEKRAPRFWVTFAGGWIQLWYATLATVIWLLSEPGSFVNTAALLTAALGGAHALLFNYNPLLPTDGYYALIDWLEIPNLRRRAFAYVRAVFCRRVLRLHVQIPSVTDRERRIFLTYGILSGLYSTVMLGVFLVIVTYVLMTVCCR
jgi:putative peptide zinc metalloprotease protein